MDDQSGESTTLSEDAGAAGASDGAPASLTDDHHDWASSFCGIVTRVGGAAADAASGAAAMVGQPAGDTGQAAAIPSKPDSDEGGGIWGAMKNAASGALDTVENVASDVGHTAVDAATGIANTVEHVAADIGHTALDAGTGLLNTAEKVGGDVVSGNFGQALGDAADGVATTAGRVVDDATHTVIDAGSGLLETAGKVVTDTEQTVADAATGVVSTAGRVVGDVAQTVAQAAGPDSMLGRAAGAVGGLATTAADGAVGAINTVTDFNKGVVEGVVGGVEGLAKGVVSLGEGVAKEGYALATDEKAREQALDTVVHGAEAVGKFEATLITDPGQAASEVGDAVVGGAKTVGHMAENVYGEYEKAAASGHGAEFIGKGVGQVGVLVAGAVLTDGASLGAEAGAVGVESAALLGEGTAVAGELGAAGAAAGELGAAGAEAAELGTAATQLGARGAGAAEELGTATTQLAERGANAAEELGTGPTAIPGADPGPLPAEFQGPSKPIKLFEKELQPIEPGSPNLTATPKPGEPIPYELGDQPPPGQMQVRPGDGSPAADPLAQTQEMPAVSMAEKGTAAGEDAAEAEAPGASAGDELLEPANEPGGEEPSKGQEEQPRRKREKAKDRQERQRKEAQAGEDEEAPAADVEPGEGKHKGPEVGDVKVPLDEALDNAGVKMEENERERFGQWVKDQHKGGQHNHYGMDRSEVRRLQQDVAAFRGKLGRGGGAVPP